MSDMVIYQNPNMDLWGLSNAVFHFYAKFRAKFPEDYPKEYEEIENLVAEIEDGMESFGEMLGGVEAKRDVWRKVNRLYAIISTIEFASGIIHDATMPHFGKLE